MNAKRITCPLTGDFARRKRSNGITIWEVCDFKYGIEDKLVTEIKNQTADKKYLIYSLLHEYFILHDKVPVLSKLSKKKKKYEFLTQKNLLSTAPKIEDIPLRALQMYAKMSENHNKYFAHELLKSDPYRPYENSGFYFTLHYNTVITSIRYLQRRGYIDVDENDRTLMIHPSLEGIKYVKGYIGDSNKGFVAMKFGKSPQWTDKNGKLHEEGERDLDEFYDDLIAPAIERAGFEPVRIDRTLHNKKIDDEILVQIRKSKFVVCDLTYENLGAYYEGGFAQGLGKEVFFICEKEFFDSHPPHFDLNHHVTALYERGKEEEFIRELAARIENNVVRI